MHNVCMHSDPGCMGITLALSSRRYWDLLSGSAPASVDRALKMEGGAGDLALALDDYSVGDTGALKVLRGAGDSGSKELEVRLKLEEDML